MKKILIALALIASVTFANAQNSVKSLSAAKSALEAAEAAANNAKKATKVATWLKLASSYMDAYNAPMGNGWIGAKGKIAFTGVGKKNKYVLSCEHRT